MYTQYHRLMSVRVVFFSDTHLGFDYPVRPRTEKVRRGPDFFANFQHVLDHAVLTEADLVIHGGDFFFRSKVHPSIVERAYQSVFEFADTRIPIAIVPGNHERSVLPPSLFLNHPNIHVFDRPRTFCFDIGNERLAVSGFPYLKNVRECFSAAVRQCEAERFPAEHRLLCVHHAVDGAVEGPANFTFRGGADVIAGTQLPTHFDAVLSGHIHRHQVLDLAVPVIYCGSIERTSYAEKSETKGFCELTLDQSAAPQMVFHELPAREMVDFDGRGYPRPDALLDALARQVSLYSPRAIVRVRLAAYPNRPHNRALAAIVPGLLSVVCARPDRRTAAGYAPNSRS
jgi:exonuclease SbcD